MALGTKDTNTFPVLENLAAFNVDSGSWFERLVFNHRPVVIFLCVLFSGVLGYFATQIQLNASFERVIPSSHPYLQNYLKNRAELPGLGNNVRIVVENRSGDIYNADYLDVLRQVNDNIFLIPGSDRSWMRSIWTPIVRWRKVTEDGISGGPVMPATYKGDAKSIDSLRRNIENAGLIGSLISNDSRSSMVIVPLLQLDPTTGKPLDYSKYSAQLEQQVRSLETDNVKIHIVGFAKLVGDLIDGLFQVLTFFGISTAIATAFVYAYTRCLRSTVLLVVVSLLGVIWMLGLMQLLGFDLDPYSILGPFLIFAIGLSHGAQKMNGILQDIGRGTHRYIAARYTFRRLFFTGLTALLVNIVGFAVMMVIDIPVIRDLAITTSIGVTVLIFTKLVLIPVALSYTGVSQKAAARAVRQEQSAQGARDPVGKLWALLTRFTERRFAIIAIVVAACLGSGALLIRSELRVGDLDAGAPELRPDSRYNRDVAFIAQHFGLSSDQFAVIVKTQEEGCRDYENLLEINRLEMVLRATPGVQTTQSLAGMARLITSASFEGNPKWYTISRDQRINDSAVSAGIIADPGVTNLECSITPLVAYLTDHKADTLTRVLNAVEKFAAQHDSEKIQFLPVAGSAGIEVVTNMVVKHSFWTMHFFLYGAVTLLCLMTFRSWRATLVALIPLVLTSLLCEALMVILGIGIKVATLPVIALGVGVGVDYALYLLGVQLMLQRRGVSLADSYRGALDFTGKVVALVGLTMAAGVVTWAWSPIKFQADMGILLTFMFLWNMIGALILIPALSHFLLKGIGDNHPECLATASSVEVKPTGIQRKVRTA
ncbi:efflux RND transporter permease subunit [Pseudomonas sp. JAI120]|uniref:efflux RND transporter permease subunit n=1 Tax=Pseudomonas sp. JAI120 TaxID=2723063 RepID=UPI0030EEDD93